MSGWKDQLVSFGGEEITYDASGNPTGYRGATLAYEGGIRLKSYKKATDANAYEFTFDEDNLDSPKSTRKRAGTTRRGLTGTLTASCGAKG